MCYTILTHQCCKVLCLLIGLNAVMQWERVFGSEQDSFDFVSVCVCVCVCLCESIIFRNVMNESLNKYLVKLFFGNLLGNLSIYKYTEIFLFLRLIYLMMFSNCRIISKSLGFFYIFQLFVVLNLIF